MNHKKVYEKARGLGEESTQEVLNDKAKAESKAQAIHNAWLQHPHTSEFLGGLQQKLNEYIVLLVETASLSEDVKVAKIASKIKELKEIYNYARGNSNSRNSAE